MGERASVLLAIVIVVLADLPTAAHADTDLSAFYTSSTLCADERATLVAGTTNSGRAAADIYSLINDGDSPCQNPASLDIGYLAQQVWIYYRNPKTGEVGLCANTDWYYNEAKVAHFGIYVDAIAGLCGTGQYRATAHGAIGINDEWKWGNSTLSSWQTFQAP